VIRQIYDPSELPGQESMGSRSWGVAREASVIQGYALIYQLIYLWQKRCANLLANWKLTKASYLNDKIDPGTTAN